MPMYRALIWLNTSFRENSCLIFNICLNPIDQRLPSCHIWEEHKTDEPAITRSYQVKIRFLEDLFFFFSQKQVTEFITEISA